MIAAAPWSTSLRLGDWRQTVVVLVFMGASQLVSYTRARAESLGAECKVGFMSRPERMVVSAGLPLAVVASWRHELADRRDLCLLAVLTSLTVVHRMLHVMRKLRVADAA